MDTTTRSQLIQALGKDRMEALRDICEQNGITEDQLVNAPDTITSIEMFLFNYPKMLCLDFFPSLRTIMLTQQTISKIENLELCTNLESIWMNENAIEQIECLNQCRHLRQLFLYSNRIRRIENLHSLTTLEVLWLSDNQISVIEGLESLPMLRELNLARNHIERIGSSLLLNSNLLSLNLSHNRIGLFTEILQLAALPKLQDLCLSDPMFGDCPVAQLCNYQTFVLYHLPKLQTLDTLQLNDEAKQVAEATFTKKRMYYNMRMKTVRRNSSNLRKRAQEGLNGILREASAAISALTGSIQDLKRWTAEAAAGAEGPAAAPPVEAEAALAKAGALQTLLDRQAREVQAVREHLALRLAAVERVAEELVRRMYVELDSGGNVRYEDGKPGDAWFASCVDLVASRFAAGDFPTASGVQSVRVQGVTRIHNRFLRHRFEQAMDGAGRKGDAATGAAGRRPVEYLFFGDSPVLTGELRKAAEEGFRHVSEYAALGLDCAVPLHTALGAADGPRFLAASKRDDGQPRFGSVLVCKVYLGACSPEAAASTRAGLVSKEQYPGSDSAYRARGVDGRNRTYYVFNHAMVLPEYLIQFEYGVQGANLAEDLLARKLQSSGMSATDFSAVFEAMDPDSKSMAQPLGPYLALATSVRDDALSRPASGASAQSSAANSDLAGNGAATWHPLGPAPITDPRVLAALKQAPQVPPLEKFYQIDQATLLRVSGKELASVSTLCLHRAGLAKVEGLHALVRGLKELVLSFNDLTSIETIVDLPQLLLLDLSFNAIKRIDGLAGLTSLKTLLLGHNRIYHQDDLAVLRKHAPGLATLDLSWNPVTTQKNYRLTAIRRLPQLQRLDGILVDDREARLGAADVSTTITPQLVQSCSTAARGFAVLDGVGWEAQVLEVRIEHRHVRRIAGLGGLPSVRVLSLHDNEITRIEGLDELTSLEELSLDDNRILEIDGLDALKNLSKLDLGRNQISMIFGLDSLVNLTQLSLEDNQIRSLHGLSRLSQLMELYVGNNNIEELRDVFGLRELPRLIILDLMGNPVCQLDDYRLYVIYHLRKLRVLDGKAIDAVEQAQAKNRYAGRLTLDFLEDRVGHRYFDRIRELDISGLRIRDVGSVFTGESFSNLRSLTMDANLMTDVWALRKLKHLNVLRMNDNRLGDASFEPPAEILHELLQAMNPAAADDSDPAPGGGGGGGVNNPLLVRGGGRLAPHPFRALQALFLNGNQISSIAALRLQGLTSLRVLHLANNEIAKLDGLEALVHLRELNLDKNKLKSIDPGALHGPTYLQFLSLEENAIRSVDGLVQCHALQVVRLGFNRLADVGRLDALAVLPRLVELTVNNNPITRKPNYRPIVLKRLPVLRLLDGREVTAEEREQVELMFPPAPDPGGLGPVGAALQQEAGRGGAGAGAGVPQRGPLRLNMMQLDLMGVAAPRDMQYGGERGGGLDVVGTRALQQEPGQSSVSMAPRRPPQGQAFGLGNQAAAAQAAAAAQGGGMNGAASTAATRWSAQRNHQLWNMKG